MQKETIVKMISGLAAVALGAWLLSSDWNYFFAYSLGVILGLMTILWLISLAIKDASIVDIFWGAGFVVTVLLFAGLTGWMELTLRQWIFVALVSTWGLRLSIYLGIRNIGKPEDYRYANWRKENGASWWWISYLQVFILQGVIMWIISALFVPALQVSGSLLLWDYVGIVFWLIGFFFEAVGDWQMMRFKRERSDDSKVMDKGLWRYTRHPNYFGDAMQWWAYFFFALASFPLGL